MPNRRYWTQEELDYLKQNYTNKTKEELTEYLDRSWGSIQTKIRDLGFSSRDVKGSRGSNWTKEEDEYLKENYLAKTTSEMAEYLNKTANAVQNRNSTLGLVGKHKRRREKIKEKDRYTFRLGAYGHVDRKSVV